MNEHDVASKPPVASGRAAPRGAGAPSVAAVLASLMRDAGLLLYSVAATLGAPYFLRRKWRLLRKGRSDSEFDLAHWNINFGTNNAPGAHEESGQDSAQTPEAQTPEAQTPEAQTPEAQTPEAQTPEAQTPEAQTPEAQTPEAGPRVAIMAASWGELVTLGPLLRALRAERPGVHLVISVQRREAVEAARALADEAVLPHPFDHIVPVARWHARARPDLVVFYEMFDFPALSRSLWVRGMPSVVVQARVGEARRGYKRRLDTPAFWRWQLQSVRALTLCAPHGRDLIAPVVPTDARLEVVGSLKFPQGQPQLEPQREAELRAWIEAGTMGAPLLVAGSTHAGEEAWVLDALDILHRQSKARQGDERHNNERSSDERRSNERDGDERRSNERDDSGDERNTEARGNERGDDERDSNERNTEARNTDARGSDARGSDARGSDARGSDARGSDARGSDARGSQGQLNERHSSERRNSEPQSDERAPVVLLAPRRLHRVGEVVQLLQTRGLRVSRRSQWRGEGARAVDVLLLDTLGELGAAYGQASGAFVGGTVNGAAHNVAEPLVWGVPVAYGPRRGNFAVEQELCEGAGVGFRVETPGELAAHWSALLESPTLRRELGAQAEMLVAAQGAAFGRALQLLVAAVDAVDKTE